jgi:signal transduction histidine kinase
MTSSPPSLKLILGGVFGLLVLMLVVLLSFTVELIATRQLQQDAQTLLITLAHEMADRLDRGLFERYREIMLTAETRTLLGNPQASVVEWRSWLAALQQTDPDIAWLGLTDANGKVIVATGGLLEGEDVSQQPWFQQGQVAAYIADVSENILPAGGEPAHFVAMAAPVYTNPGELIGVVGAYLNLTWAQDAATALLRPVNGERQMEVFVVSQNGEVLFGPTAWSGRQLDVPGVTTMPVEHEYAAVATWPDGIEYVAGVAPTRGYRDYPGLGWSVLVRQPVNQAYVTAKRIQWLIVVVGGMCALLFALVAWLLADRLTRQLQAITNAANRVRQGEANVVIPLLTGSAEVATLSASLNQLIEELTTATTAERNRIARDLHDSVTQTLFSASMLADVLPKVWEASPDRGKAKLEELRRAVRGALAEMRTLLLELRPAALIDAEMERLLRQLADATSGRSGVSVNWQVEGACALPSDVKVAFYRTVQEALSNVVKHAGASQVVVRLRCAGQHTELTIRDDGCGFELAEVTGDHFGLAMMRERIEAIGGVLHIDSQPNQGTEIQVVWPDGQG